MNTNHAAFASTLPGKGLRSPINSHAANSIPSLNWTPSRKTLQAIANLLKETTTGNTNVQSQIYGQLQFYATQKEFNNYLVYIFVSGDIITQLFPQQIEGIRQAAGLLLNSNIRLLYSSLSSLVREYMHAQLLIALADTSNIIRHVAATCIATIVITTNEIGAFTGLIDMLAQSLDSNNPNVLDGAFKALSHLAEDVPNLLKRDTSRPLDTLLPKIVQLCHHEKDSVRADSLRILNHFILVMPKALYDNVDGFCQTLFRRAEDSSAQVRKRVCTAICLLTEIAPRALMPHMNSVIRYMLASSKHPDELIACEALEFWSLIANLRGGADVLRPFLNQIIPVLLTNMEYSREEISLHEAANVPDDMFSDREEDLRPRFHQPNFKASNSAKGEGGIESSGQGINQNSTAHGKDSSHEEYGSEDEAVDWEDFKGESDWNLRKCSAEALDSFAVLFKDELLPVLLPGLQEKLTDRARWERRECGVLALGAIAEGCYTGMLRHMSSVFPFLLQATSDQQVMVRTMACWTLSRYSKWAISERDDALVQQLLKVFLDRMHDGNKLVQKAACSAVAVFIEESGSLLKTYFVPLLTSVRIAFQRYQRCNAVVLFDIMSTMVDTVGAELAKSGYLNSLMPILISRWNSMSDMDPLMLSLLECLGHVFRALGIHSQQYAANIFSRCCNLMDGIYAKELRGEREDNHVEFLTSCLDLMCALAEALGLNVEQFVSVTANGPKSVLPILLVCMKDYRREIRQSVFALLGEFARSRIPSLIPALPQYICGTVEALNPEHMAVSNNATWALGELVMMAGFLPSQIPVNRESIKRTLLEGALDALIRAMNTPQLNKSLLENSALTLGRVGLILSESVAPKLGTFAEPVFSSLQNIRDDVEKEQAFHGMNAMVKVNPTAIFACFVHYVSAIASWFHCKPTLEMEFASILRGFKASLGDQWFPLFNTLPSTLQTLLKERFGI